MKAARPEVSGGPLSFAAGPSLQIYRCKSDDADRQLRSDLLCVKII